MGGAVRQGKGQPWQRKALILGLEAKLEFTPGNDSNADNRVFSVGKGRLWVMTDELN